MSRSDGPRPRGSDGEPALPRSIGATGPAEPALPDLLAIRIEEPETPPHRASSGGGVPVLSIGLALGAVAAGLVALVAVVGLAAGAYFLTRSSDPVAVAPTPPPVAPAPLPAPAPATIEPAPVEPAPAPVAAPAPATPGPVEPAPQPAPVKPGPQPAPAPQPAPEPAPAPQPAPVPVARPQPVEVHLDPEPFPEPPPDPTISPDTPATLIVEGNAPAVELQGDYGGFRMGTPLPPGAYQVWADFGEGLVDTGVRTIAEPGGKVFANCSVIGKSCLVSP